MTNPDINYSQLESDFAIGPKPPAFYLKPTTY